MEVIQNVLTLSKIASPKSSLVSSRFVDVCCNQPKLWNTKASCEHAAIANPETNISSHKSGNAVLARSEWSGYVISNAPGKNPVPRLHVNETDQHKHTDESAGGVVADRSMTLSRRTSSKSSLAFAGLSMFVTISQSG